MTHLPPTITPHQFDLGRRLLAAQRTKQHTVAALTKQLATLESQANADSRYLSERCDFRRTPAKLAGLAEFVQRNQPQHHPAVLFQYQWLLREMLDPLPTLQGGPALRPFTVDFAALPLAARPYLLGPYLGIFQNQRFAEVDLHRSRPSQGRLTMLQTGGPIDVEQWRAALPALNAWLGDGWGIAANTASTISFIRRTPLPTIIPFQRSFLRSGALFAGFNTDTHHPVMLPFSELPSGIFIAGASGTGKSSALHVLLRSLFANLAHFEAVYLVDGKDGVGFARYQHLHPKVHVLWEREHLWQLTERLVAIMAARNQAQRQAGIDNATGDFIALVIDEMAAYTAKPSVDPKHPANKLHLAFIDNLVALAMRGRSTGLRMIVTAQSPVAEQVPVPVRSNCATTISFKLLTDAHATSLFGQLDGLPADPRKLTRGRALISHGLTGTYDAVQFPIVIPPSRGGS